MSMFFMDKKLMPLKQQPSLDCNCPLSKRSAVSLAHLFHVGQLLARLEILDETLDALSEKLDILVQLVVQVYEFCLVTCCKRGGRGVGHDPDRFDQELANFFSVNERIVFKINFIKKQQQGSRNVREAIFVMRTYIKPKNYIANL